MGNSTSLLYSYLVSFWCDPSVSLHDCLSNTIMRNYEMKLGSLIEETGFETCITNVYLISNFNDDQSTLTILHMSADVGIM